MNYKELINLIDRHDVISFDIFDTLFVRLTNKPSDIFELVSRKYENDIGYLKYNFKELRLRAELEARKSTELEEVTLDEIYGYISKYIKEKYILDSLKNIEIKCEENFITINKEMKLIYDYCLKKNKRIIITSDMYLPKKFIENLLSKFSIINYNKLYLSSEEKKTKHNGTLFELIINEQNINSNRILHIGDNVKSDYKVPKKFGISSFKYINNNLQKSKNKNLYDNIYENLIEYTFNNNIENNEYNNWLYEFGYKNISPLFIGYVKWIYDKAIEKNIDRIYFLARDGYLLYNLFNIINCGKFEVYYLEVSRKVFNTNNNRYDELLIEYLNEYKVYDSGNIALIDIGYNGTIQREILNIKEKINSSVEIYGYYFATKNFDYEVMKGNAYIINNNKPKKNKDIIYISTALLEVFLLSPNGSVIGYSKRNANITPIYGQNDYSKLTIDSVEIIHKAIIQCCKRIFAVYKNNNYIEIDQQIGIDRLYKVLKEPTIIQAKILGEFTISDNNTADNIKFIAKRCENKKNIKKVLSEFKESYWKIGYIKRNFKIQGYYIYKVLKFIGNVVK